MSAFTGPQRRGAKRDRKAEKRKQAEGRNRRTPEVRRKRHRRAMKAGGTP